MTDQPPVRDVQRCVRLVSLLSTVVIGVLAGAPVLAQQATPAADPPPLQLPVSLEHIRAALERSPTQRLKVVERKPDFRVEIQERRRIEELLASLDFNGGPVPAAGLYAYEQMQRIGSPWGSVPIVSVDLLRIFKGIGGQIASAKQSSAQKAAREEVRGAIADYCAAQPNRGAGIQLCASSPATR